MSNHQVHALIPAAGCGSRFGGEVPKQYLTVCGKAVLAHSIRVFKSHPSIAGITVVLAENDQWFNSAVGSVSAEVETVTGGETRTESVRNGLRFIADRHPETTWVLIHDAVRPCLSRQILDRLLKQGLGSVEGAILAMPVGDTLKRVGKAQEIVATVDRHGLWAAQTPQLFRLAALSDAIDAALRDGCDLTDEASAMEYSGVRPKLVMGSVENIKITHPGDLAIAEAWLGSTNLRAE